MNDLTRANQEKERDTQELELLLWTKKQQSAMNLQDQHSRSLIRQNSYGSNTSAYGSTFAGIGMHKCPILKQKDTLANYSELAENDTRVIADSVWDSEGNGQSTYTVYSELDRTNDLNCFIQWKNNLHDIMNNQFDTIDMKQMQNNLNDLQSKIELYTNSIEELDDLQQTLRGYENTKLDYIDDEFKIEREMQKSLLKDFITRAKNSRLAMQDDFDRKIVILEEEQKEKLAEKDLAHKNVIDSNTNQFQSEKSLLVSDHEDELEQKDDQIHKLRSINAGTKGVYNQKLIDINEQLEATNVLNNQKDLKLQFASLENQTNAKLYDNLKDDNKELEIISQNAHNILTGQNINNKINKDMKLINQIQSSSRESFTNILDDNQHNFLLGLGVFSIGLFIYKMNK